MQRHLLIVAALAAAMLATPSRAFIELPGEPDLTFDTELLSMDLTGSVSMPMSNQGGNVGPEGFVYMDVEVTLREAANLQSLGYCNAYDLGDGLWHVDSFFDVFFDVTLKDIDPFSNFTGELDGASLQYNGKGPMQIQSSFDVQWDGALPNGGLFPPPESAPYELVEAFSFGLGKDINGNGYEDKLTIDSILFKWLNANRQFVFVPTRGTWSVGSEMLLSGGVSDIFDPPFGPLLLTGPTTASAHLFYMPQTIPEPGSLGLLGLGLVALARRRRR